MGKQIGFIASLHWQFLFQESISIFGKIKRLTSLTNILTGVDE
jgi:hypothetical protein